MHETHLRRKRNVHTIEAAENKLGVDVNELQDAPPVSDDNNFNIAMDFVCAFEPGQLSYTFGYCSMCHERRFEMQMTAENTLSLRQEHDKTCFMQF